MLRGLNLHRVGAQYARPGEHWRRSLAPTGRLITLQTSGWARGDASSVNLGHDHAGIQGDKAAQNEAPSKVQ